MSLSSPTTNILTTRSVRLSSIVALLLGAAACQSTPAAHSGFLSSYAGLGAKAEDGKGPSTLRDDALSDQIAAVYIEPSILALGDDTALSSEEQTMVMNEVDRQICFEVSERFTVLPQASDQAGIVRTAIVRIDSTSRMGSAVSAAAGFFNPVPLIEVRTPMATGGLAIESEMMTADGRQVAAITWARQAEIVGRAKPSMSRIGDALQLAEPMGDAVGDAFASKARKVRDIPEPDPCARYGSRRDLGRTAASGALGAATGLYAPQVSGAGAAAEPLPRSPR